MWNLTVACRIFLLEILLMLSGTVFVSPAQPLRAITVLNKYLESISTWDLLELSCLKCSHYLEGNPVAWLSHQFGRNLSCSKIFMAAVGQVVLSNISGSSRSHPADTIQHNCFTKSAKSCIKISRETCTNLRPEIWQESEHACDHQQHILHA